MSPPEQQRVFECLQELARSGTALVYVPGNLPRRPVGIVSGLPQVA